MSGESNPLNSASLSRLMAASLPQSTSPQIKTPYDAVALAVHASMIAVGFRLVGLDEDHNLESTSSDTETSVLPLDWNKSSTVSFRYAHSQSSMKFVVKVSRLGSSATIDAVALGHDKRVTFDLPVQDYISQSAVPATPVSQNSQASSEKSLKAIQDIFISQHRLTDLGALVKQHIIQKLMPGLHKEGYEEAASDETSSSAPQARDNPPPSRPMQPTPYNVPEPLRDNRFPPRVPAPGERPPGFEDEYEILRPMRDGRMPASPFGHIGADDLNPPGLGSRDPLLAGRGGVGRPPQGMHPTPDDILGRNFDHNQEFGDMRVPHGARYDPTFPGDPHDPNLRRGGNMGGGFGPGSGFPGSGFPGGGFPGGGFI